MAYDWGEYLNFADQLLNNTPIICNETKYRNIVSRSYYAAFHMTKNILNIPSYTNDLELIRKSHQVVIAQLYDLSITKNNPKLSVYANDLGELKRDRVLCDYKNYKSATKTMAEIDYQKSKAICDYLSTNQC